MMHGRAFKRIEKEKKICVQYRSIDFLLVFFVSFFSVFCVLLNDKCIHMHIQTVFHLSFFLTWELDHDYDRNIYSDGLILFHQVHQATLDHICFRRHCHLLLAASYIKINTVTKHALHTWSCNRNLTYCHSQFHIDCWRLSNNRISFYRRWK